MSVFVVVTHTLAGCFTVDGVVFYTNGAFVGRGCGAMLDKLFSNEGLGVTSEVSFGDVDLSVVTRGLVTDSTVFSVVDAVLTKVGFGVALVGLLVAVALDSYLNVTLDWAGSGLGFLKSDLSGLAVFAEVWAWGQGSTLFRDVDALLVGDFGAGDLGTATGWVAADVLFFEASSFGFSTVSAAVVAERVLLAAGVLTTFLSARVSVASVVTFPSAARSAVDLLLYLSGLLLLTLLGDSVTPVR